MSAAFDTLKYARRLKEAGVPEAQAEIHAEALRGALEEQVMACGERIDRELSDIKAGLVRLDGKFDALEERTKGRFDALEERTQGRFTLLQWMMTFNLALTVAVLWLLIRA